jgi:PAS domain-containing protein
VSLEAASDLAGFADPTRSERARGAELNAIISAIGEGIVVVERDGAVSLANRTARRLLAPAEPTDLESIPSRRAWRTRRIAGSRSRAIPSTRPTPRAQEA